MRQCTPPMRNPREERGGQSALRKDDVDEHRLVDMADTEEHKLQRPSATRTRESLEEVVEHSGTPRRFRKPKSSFDLSQDAHADRATLSWVNTLLGWIWPKANSAIETYVREDLTPVLQEQMPALLRGVRFSRFSIGKNTPDFGPVEVVRHSESQVQVDLHIRYDGDVDIEVDAGTGGIKFGINKLHFEGLLCIVLRPLVDKWPVVGAMKWYFADRPKVDLKFSGLAALANYHIDSQVQYAVASWMQSMVLPNHKLWRFNTESVVDMMEAHSLAPLGALRVRVVGAEGLPGVNWSAMEVDRWTSDPYCVLASGAQSMQTSTVSNSTDPVWPADEPSQFLVVYHNQQGLEIEVRGASGRFLQSNAHLGLMPSTSIERLMTKWPEVERKPGSRRKMVLLDTSGVSKDMLHVNDPVLKGDPSKLEVEIEWFDILDRPGLGVGAQVPPSPAERFPAALLLLELHKGDQFPADVIKPGKGLRWQCHVADGRKPQSLISQRGRLSDMEGVEFPDVDIDKRLQPVVDKLEQYKQTYNFSEEEIAQIIGVNDPTLVRSYIDAREHYKQASKDMLKRQRSEEHRVSVEWYETLVIFVSDIQNTSVNLELLDGDDHVLGHLGEDENTPCLVLRQVFQKTYNSAKRMSSLWPPKKANSGFASWFSQAPSSAALNRYQHVQFTYSAQLRFLRPGRTLPKRASYER